MPRRSVVDVVFNEPIPKANDQHKTQRSHEENQERAYVAASRRSDRCIEARIQSARMASEIHKKRTGRGFKITKEIVLNEEMYEEENDNLPRSHRLLGANLQTQPADMNARMEADLSNKIEVSEMLAKADEEWRRNEINRLFAQSFPNAMTPVQQEAQITTNAAASQHSVEAYSPTAYAPISCPLAPEITAQAAPSHISASTSHHRQTTRNRRGSCTSSSPMSSSRENSLQTVRLADSSSPETTSTTATTPGYERSSSPKFPANSTSRGRSASNQNLAAQLTPILGEVGANALIVPTVVKQEIVETQFLPNSPLLHELSEMPDVTQMSQVGSGSLPDHYPYGNATDETDACEWPMPSITNDPWQAFINDSMWVADLQH